jgi:signal transduction histidine kinase
MGNQLTRSFGYLELEKKRTNDAVLLNLIEKQRDVLKNIQRIMSFTEAYRDLGLQAPEWLSVAAQAHLAARNEYLGQIELDLDCGDLEVFADRMLERVFGNLLENALCHGERVTRIALACAEAHGRLKLIWQDDGIGIPEDKKKKVFEMGFGKDSGHGLFLIREVLGTTNIEIVENGVPGQGGRFEITVPPGGWRHGAPQSTPRA